jgi:hypothetical protein
MCNSIESLDKSYCITSTGTCTLRATTTAFKSNKANPTQSFACTDAYDKNGRCVALASDNCAISFAESNNYVCVSGYDLLTSKCKDGVSSDKVSSLNGRCDLTATPKQVCPLGTECNNNVCRALAPVGAFCSENNNCITSLCDHRKCSIARSLPDGSYCENTQSCKSGLCSSGICSVFSSAPCYDNTQCMFSSEKCKLPSGTTNSDSVGKCYSRIPTTSYDLEACIYNKCSSIYGTTLGECLNVNCTKEHVTDVCAKNCRLHQERRYDPSYGAFTYDCTALKRTAWATTACEQKVDTQITLCTGQDY